MLYWLLINPARIPHGRSSRASTVFSFSRDRMSVTVRPTAEKSLSQESSSSLRHNRISRHVLLPELQRVAETKQVAPSDT